MSNKLLHTPEGVRDIYNDQFSRKLFMLQELSTLLTSYGYEPIQTPTFEFFDIFGDALGTIQAKDLYKFYDKEGHTLVLRPDITPSIARAASKYFDVESKPVRLCYQGNVFINNTSYQGRMKESTQVGAEFIGENSIYADAEILAMVVRSLQRVGLKQFQISIGHVDLFLGLVEAAGLDEAQASELKNLVHNKNIFGVEAFLSSFNLPEDLNKLFSILVRMYADPDEWVAAVELSKSYPKIHNALEYLQELYKVLSIYGVDSYISFEMSLIGTHAYYTGILFKGYTFGSGEPIVLGGRYDGLLSYFGKEAPAIGFALMADRLLGALERQGIDTRRAITMDELRFTADSAAEAIQNAEAMRAEGKNVTLTLEA